VDQGRREASRGARPVVPFDPAKGDAVVTQPLVLPVVVVDAFLVVVAFLVGFTIGYRHGFSRRQRLAHAATSRRSHSRQGSKLN
jgi:hypothetical protein